jgi:hypothetical protein
MSDNLSPTRTTLTSTIAISLDNPSSGLPITPPDTTLNQVLQNLQQGDPETNDVPDEPASKKGKYIKLSYDHFERLMNTCTDQQALISRFIDSPDSTLFHGPNGPPSSRPAYYANAKFEEIACRAIKPTYDGGEDHLIPFLSRLDIRRQNEGWATATYIHVNGIKYDLTCNFASVQEADITALAERRWTAPSVDIDKHSVDHDTYNSRLLSIVLMNSITDDLLTTILNRIPRLLRNDGTYLLWSLSHNIHRNNVAFTEHVREKITLATLSQHNNDVTKYIIYVKDNLRMITNTDSSTSEHNGLITYILRQLKDSSIQMFQRYIRDLHVDFQEGKLKNKTITNMLLDIEDKIRILKHAGEWVETEPTQPTAMALAAGTKLPPQLEELLSKQIKAQLNQLVERHKSLHNTNHNNQNKNGFVHQEWMFNPPATAGETRQFNNKTYTWCTKCRQGRGQWVSAHDSNTHVDGFRPTNRRYNNSTNNRQQRTGILKNGPKKDPPNHLGNTNINKANVSFADGASNGFDTVNDGLSAQLSLQDGISSCFYLPDPDED